MLIFLNGQRYDNGIYLINLMIFVNKFKKIGSYNIYGLNFRQIYDRIK